MTEIYFYEAFAEEEAKLRLFLPEHLQCKFNDRTIQESGHQKPPGKLISIRTQSLIPADWASHLSGILTRSTGYDHLLKYRRDTGTGLQCGYLPLYCNRAVAEQAMMMWMMLLRKSRQQVEHFWQFNRDGLTGRECRGKTLSVVGVGNIGSEVVKIGQGLEMNVLGVDIVQKHSFVDYFSLEEALPRADVIVCAMNLTRENRAFFNYRRLKQTRPGVIFINVARGEMSPPRDLLELVNEGHLGGLGMDVFDQESLLAVALRTGQREQDPAVIATLELAARENVIFTPHNAFNTIESVDRKAEQSMEQIRYFGKHGKFKWPVPGE